ncbi:Anoctamin-7 [Phlyctochytrium bullatum]|nr:Anoctamin-7 [Phlyctochytrium bullatum]
MSSPSRSGHRRQRSFGRADDEVAQPITGRRRRTPTPTTSSRAPAAPENEVPRPSTSSSSSFLTLSLPTDFQDFFLDSSASGASKPADDGRRREPAVTFDHPPQSTLGSAQPDAAGGDFLTGEKGRRPSRIPHVSPNAATSGTDARHATTGTALHPSHIPVALHPPDSGHRVRTPSPQPPHTITPNPQSSATAPAGDHLHHTSHIPRLAHHDPHNHPTHTPASNPTPPATSLQATQHHPSHLPRLAHAHHDLHHAAQPLSSSTNNPSVPSRRSASTQPRSTSPDPRTSVRESTPAAAASSGTTYLSPTAVPSRLRVSAESEQSTLYSASQRSQTSSPSSAATPSPAQEGVHAQPTRKRELSAAPSVHRSPPAEARSVVTMASSVMKAPSEIPSAPTSDVSVPETGVGGHLHGTMPTIHVMAGSTTGSDVDAEVVPTIPEPRPHVIVPPTAPRPTTPHASPTHHLVHAATDSFLLATTHHHRDTLLSPSTPVTAPPQRQHRMSSPPAPTPPLSPLLMPLQNRRSQVSLSIDTKVRKGGGGVGERKSFDVGVLGKPGAAGAAGAAVNAGAGLAPPPAVGPAAGTLSAPPAGEKAPRVEGGGAGAFRLELSQELDRFLAGGDTVGAGGGAGDSVGPRPSEKRAPTEKAESKPRVGATPATEPRDDNPTVVMNVIDFSATVRKQVAPPVPAAGRKATARKDSDGYSLRAQADGEDNDEDDKPAGKKKSKGKDKAVKAVPQVHFAESWERKREEQGTSTGEGWLGQLMRQDSSAWTRDGAPRGPQQPSSRFVYGTSLPDASPAFFPPVGVATTSAARTEAASQDPPRHDPGSPSTSVETTVDFPRDLVLSDFEECLAIEREAFGEDPESFFASLHGHEEAEHVAASAALRKLADEGLEAELEASREVAADRAAGKGKTVTGKGRKVKEEERMRQGLADGCMVLTRRYGRSLVHFLYKEDLDLFDEVTAFKELHPRASKFTAFENFAGRGHSDAIVKIVYADHDTHWDAILKYQIHSRIARLEDELFHDDDTAPAAPHHHTRAGAATNEPGEVSMRFPTSAAAAAAATKKYRDIKRTSTSSSWTSWLSRRTSGGAADRKGRKHKGGKNKDGATFSSTAADASWGFDDMDPVTGSKRYSRGGALDAIDEEIEMGFDKKRKFEVPEALRVEEDGEESADTDDTLEEITAQRIARAHYERELLRHHLILVRERGLDVDMRIGRNVATRIHYVKIMASFDTLCLEAERIKLKMEVSEKHMRVREHFYKKVANAKGADKFAMAPHQRKQLRDLQLSMDDHLTRQQRYPGESAATRRESARSNGSSAQNSAASRQHGRHTHAFGAAITPRTPRTPFSAMGQQGSTAYSGPASASTSGFPFHHQKHGPFSPSSTSGNTVSGLTPFKRLSSKQFREGPDGTFIGTLRFIFSLVPHPIDLESDAFDRSRLEEFRGGDGAALGKSYAQVCLDFFPNSKRNLLVHIIAQRCKIHEHSGKVYNIGINHLLLEGTYTDFYAVHDGPYRIKGKSSAPTQPGAAAVATPPQGFSGARSMQSPPATPISAIPSQAPPPTNPSRENQRAWLYENWARLKPSWSQLLLEQPLREIRDYFGERVAYYFTWLGFYTLWLWIPALVGLLVCIYGWRTAEPDNLQNMFDNALTTPFAFFMAVWAALFLEFWKRQESTLNTVWDVLDVETVETKRPEWYGTHLRRSPVTGKIEIHFPKHLEIIIRVVTSVILFFAILLMVGFEVVVILAHSAALRINTPWLSSTNFASVITGAMTLFNIICLTPIYLRLSTALNRWENHRTLEKFDNSLIFKGFIVSFVNNYSTLIYVSFIKVFVGRRLPAIGLYEDSCDPTLDSDPNNPYSSCMAQLMLNMFVIFVGLQFFNQARLVILPLFRQKIRRALRRYQEADKTYYIRRGDDGSSKGSRRKGSRNQSVDSPTGLSSPNRSAGSGSSKADEQVQPQLSIPQFVQDDLLDTWHQREEFTSKMVQFGFIALFSCGFPLAPFFALINNGIEIRLGAFRLVAESRRPFVSRTQGIGAWIVIANMIARMGVLFNALTIAFSSQYFTQVYLAGLQKEYHLGAKMIFVLVFENAVFLLVFIIDWLVPDIPGKVKHALERQRYLARIESGQEIEDEDEVSEAELGLKAE